MIKLLDGDERKQLSPVFAEEFEAIVPDERNANIIAVVEDGEIQGFVTSEILIRVGQIWTKSADKAANAKICKDMIRYVVQSIPKGASVITIASEKRFEGLFKKLGMREVEGTVYRIDF